MDLLSINWLAVGACVLAGFVSGALWYNPSTFFLVWWKGIGKSHTEIPGSGKDKGMALVWALTALSLLVEAVFMAVAVNAAAAVLGGPSLKEGVELALLLWCGLVAPTYLANKLFAGHGLLVWAIEAGNHLVNLVAFGAILGAWR